MSGLIDTTEMYLKIVYELKEEGVSALRARIVERLGQSGPTVSETVKRMERDDLLRVCGDRQLEFTELGGVTANKVMRKHRIAERLLADIIKVPLAQVHREACRWEHVMSDEVAEQIAQILPNVEYDPFGNVIPVLSDEYIPPVSVLERGFVALADLPKTELKDSYTIKLFLESLQDNQQELERLVLAGVLPEATVVVEFVDDSVVVESTGHSKITLDNEIASQIFVL